MDSATEILINSSLVTHDDFGDSYEFVLNDNLEVMECVRIESLVNGSVTQIKDAPQLLDGMLFELNHVRVNPRIDNTYIIDCFTRALNNIGVNVHNQPNNNAMSMCFKPLGEISDNVRFYISDINHVVFLSPATKPRLVVANLPQSN